MSRPVLIVAVLLVLGTRGTSWADEVNFDFRGKKFDEELLRFDGPNPEQYIRLEEEGLRITFPAGNAPRNAVGVRWNCRVRGDFMAALHYEIMKAEPSPNGTGVELYLVLDNHPDPAIRDGMPLSRLVRGAEGSAWWTVTHMTGARPNRRAEGYKMVATTAPRGRLRIERQGGVFIASVAEGDTEPFQELNRFEIGTMDIPMVRLAGLASGSQTAELDMRLLDVQLKGELVGLTVKATPATKAERSSLRVVIVIGLVTLLLFLAVGALIWKNRSNGKKDLVPTEQKPAALESIAQEGQGVPNEAVLSKMTAAEIRVACAKCGKKLKVKETSAGKLVKCPHCGEAVQVPA